MQNLPKQNILGVEVTRASKEEILEFITRSLEEKEDPYYIVTPNPEMVVSADQNPSRKAMLNQARISLADGVGLTLAARVLGEQRVWRFAGVDCMEELCKRAVGKPITVGFLGGRGGVAERTAECLLQKYPGLRVAFIGEDWSDEGWRKGAEAQRSRGAKETSEKKENAPEHLRTKAPSHDIDILFVAFGFPKQESFMAEHVGKVPVRVMMGVGGAFDYFSGRVPRAPKFLQRMGFEWVYRLIKQPWRLKRQVALLSFLLLLFRTRFSR